jgi:hypothetical protein
MAGTAGTNGCNEGFTVAGMQTLLDSVRATGATNVVQVSGVDYANTLTQFLTHKPNDAQNNLMVAADIYMDLNPCKTTTCYNSEYLPIINAGIPFIAGEFGESVNGNVCSVTNSNILLNWIDSNGGSGYMAWVWDTWGTSCGDLSLITNFNGTAHSPNGTNYKTRLSTLASAGQPNNIFASLFNNLQSSVQNVVTQLAAAFAPTQTQAASTYRIAQGKTHNSHQHVVLAASTTVGWSSGFYPGWDQNGYPPSSLPWNSLTHLIQFSVMTSPNRNGSIDTTAHGLSPQLMQAAVAETHSRNKKILISIGGAEDNNWDAACNPTNRSTFITNIVSLVQQYGYDGIDLDIEQDWQSPAHTDYIACVAGIRNAFNNLSPRPVISEDGDPNWQAYMLVQVWQYLDQINIMSYWADEDAIPK